MKIINKHFFISVIIFFCCFNSFGQQNEIDSLLSLLRSPKAHLRDTTRINILNNLSSELNSINPDTAVILSVQALSLAEVHQKSLKEGDEGGGVFIAQSYNNLGTVYRLKNKYPLALDCFFKGIALCEKLEKKTAPQPPSGKGRILNIKSAIIGNIGSVYREQENYPKALDYYFKGLKLSLELGNKKGVFFKLGNIGNVYYAKHDYAKALEFYLKALKMAEDMGSKYGICTALGNIGNVYSDQGDSALEKGNRKFAFTDRYPKALDHYSKALKMDAELQNRNGIAIQLVNIGSVYVSLKKYNKAENYLVRALELDDSVGEFNHIMLDEKLFSKMYLQMADEGLRAKDGKNYYKLAFEHYKKYIAAKDSIFNEENTKKTVRSEMNFEFDKKQTEEKAEQDKKDVIATQELKQQRLQRNYFIVGFALVLLLALFIFRSYRQKQKANEIITLQKAEVEEQKKVVEEKNKDILDSIHYAKRIQDALLKTEEHISKHLPEHFILFMPKDIVSGDFYWATEKQGHWYVAAVDCTGHGVPGAFMSMLGMSFLNDIVSVEKLLTPAEILNQLRDKIVNELRQTGEAGGSKDGMDISLIRLHLQTNELQWAGANNALNLVRSGELQEIKADKQPIGYHPEPKLFTNHEIQIKKGDSIYIFSDGYADQFGGPNGKKFKYKQLEDLVLANNQLPLEQQKQILKKAFVEWRGNLEQVDDVCVIGVRI
jgi:serine phosphatase RsbU (regulator of sigma subunit)/tetratricopeptide (TPR) repeat protein